MTKIKQTFNIKETAEQLVPDSLGRSSYLIALIIALIMFGIIGAIYIKLPPNIPLYFTLPWGEARLAAKLSILLLPVTTIFIIIFNISLGRVASKLSPLLPRSLAVASLVISLMMMIAIFGIVQSLIL
jgi:hypothetical protein